MRNAFWVIATVILLSACSPEIYRSPNMEVISRGQQTVAVLPFETTLDLTILPTKVASNDVKRATQHTSYMVQKDTHAFLKTHAYTKRLNVTLQDVSTTNDLLEEAGLAYEDILLMDKGELCETLGVDGIISGKIRTSKPMSDGTALVALLAGGFVGSTNEVSMTIAIHHKLNSQLMWRYSYEKRGAIGSSADGLTHSILKDAVKNFPYTSKGKSAEGYY